jgi:hypothetical protein
MSKGTCYRLLSIYLFFLITHYNYAQEKIFTGNININEKDTRFIYGVEKNGTMLLDVNESEGIDKFFLINSKGEVIQVYNIGFSQGKVHNVVHLNAKDDYFYVYTFHIGYFTQPNGDRISLTHLQYLKFAKDGSLIPEFTILTGTNPYDQHMTTFSKNDTTYIIGVNKLKYTVAVNIITPKQEVIRKEFALSDKKIFKKFYRVDYFHVKDLPENSFETFLHKNKVYLHNKELVFISDDEDREEGSLNTNSSLDRNTTFITRLNLVTGKSSVKELQHNYKAKANHNSYLHGNDLYTIGFTNEEYSISVIDFETLKELQKISQAEIENSIDWSKLIVSENKTLFGDLLKADFQKKIDNSTPVIGLHYKNDTQIFFGLLGNYNRTEGGNVKLKIKIEDKDGNISSLGQINQSSRTTSTSGITNPYGPNNSPSFFQSENVLIKLPMYYVSASIRSDGRRMYGKIPFQRQGFKLSTSIRPTSIYDELDLITEKWEETHDDKLVYSFENNEAVFLAYFQREEKTEDVYVVVEKYPRK